MFAIVTILLVASNLISAIDWRIDDNDIIYASDCDFTGNVMYEVRSTAQRCGPICKTTPGCTHFAWANDDCWLKQNSISRHQAFYAKNVLCGVVPYSYHN